MTPLDDLLRRARDDGSGDPAHDPGFTRRVMAQVRWQSVAHSADAPAAWWMPLAAVLVIAGGLALDAVITPGVFASAPEAWWPDAGDLVECCLALAVATAALVLLQRSERGSSP